MRNLTPICIRLCYSPGRRNHTARSINARWRGGLALILLPLFAAWGQAARAPEDSAFPAYCLPHTEVRSLHSAVTEIDYTLYVSLPRHYADTDKAYPVIFVLDADYAFALAHNIIEHLVDRRNLPEMMVVGIAYAGASQVLPVYRHNRTRDYTPTPTLDGGYGPEFQKFSGGGEQFRRFIVTELIPFIAAQYRVKPDDLTLVGHSYGGLFATYLLLTNPEAFQRYIIVSPSYWYDHRVIFTFEAQAATVRQRLPARVFLAVGSQENPIMAQDLEQFAAVLTSRQYQGLQMSSRIFPDENHNSVFPAALTRGLRVVFEGETP